MGLKSFQENVRLQTFSRSGYQQIQLDAQYLRDPLQDYVDDETVVNFLLDEVSEYQTSKMKISLPALASMCKFFICFCVQEFLNLNSLGLARSALPQQNGASIPRLWNLQCWTG